MRNLAEDLPNDRPARAHRRRGLCAHGSLIPLAALAISVATGPAAADGLLYDHWTPELVDRMITARTKEALVGRATPIEQRADLDSIDLRPQQRATASSATRRSRRGATAAPLTSLTREGLPMSLLPDLGSGRLPISGDVRQTEPSGPVLASLGGAFDTAGAFKAPSLSGGSIRWLASAECLATPLRTVLAEVAARFGPLRVNSTCRSKVHNARVGGAKRSYHLTGNAVDFRVSGSIKEIQAFLAGKRVVGGLKHYGFGLFHIDTGPRRTWASKPRRRKA